MKPPFKVAFFISMFCRFSIDRASNNPEDIPRIHYDNKNTSERYGTFRSKIFN